MSAPRDAGAWSISRLDLDGDVHECSSRANGVGTESPPFREWVQPAISGTAGVRGRRRTAMARRRRTAAA